MVFDFLSGLADDVFEFGADIFSTGSSNLPWLDDVAAGSLAANPFVDMAVYDAAASGFSFFDTVKTGVSAVKGITSLAGAASGPVGTYMGAQSTAYAAKQASRDLLARADGLDYQSGISTLNADIASKNLAFERESLELTDEILERQTSKVIGEAKTMYSAAGVALSGSALDVLGDTAAEGRLARSMASFESFHRQFGFETERDVNLREAEQYAKSAVQSRENAQDVLEEGLAASNLQELTSFAEGVLRIPDIVNGAEDVFEEIFG